VNKALSSILGGLLVYWCHQLLLHPVAYTRVNSTNSSRTCEWTVCEQSIFSNAIIAI